MSEELQQTIKEIKKQLRLSMNGVVSTLQRRQGLDYKINFGVEIPRLKEIALRYSKDVELAEELWKENIRESKLLAIFLSHCIRLLAILLGSAGCKCIK